MKGVTIWVTDYNRSLAAKLAKDFFSEPSQASITCAGVPGVCESLRAAQALPLTKEPRACACSDGAGVGRGISRRHGGRGGAQAGRHTRLRRKSRVALTRPPPGAQQIFSEGKNLFQTKTLRIRRIQDVKNSSLIYVAYR